MRNLFLPCASLRLLLPDILVNHHSLIYLDTDLIFLQSLQELWKEFGSFSSKTLIAGISRFGEEDQNRQINSGILLMNLTQMRQVQWTQKNLLVAQENIHKHIFDQVNGINSINRFIIE